MHSIGNYCIESKFKILICNRPFKSFVSVAHLQDGKNEVLSFTGELILVGITKIYRNSKDVFAYAINSEYSYNFAPKTWKDENLVWNETEYNGIWGLTLSVEDVWIPDVNIANR